MKVFIVSTAHLTHDIFTSFLAPVLPLLIDNFGLSYFNSSLLNIVRKLPSLFSLLLGSLIAKLDERYLHYLIAAAPLITSILMSLLGIIPSYNYLLLVLLLVGFSSSIFHILAPTLIKKVSGKQVGFNWSEIIDRKDKIVTQLTQGIDSLLSKHNVELISGKAQLVDQETVRVTKDKEEVEVDSEKIILATGSQPVELPIVNENAEKHLIYSKQALDLDELPEELVIIGGGVIGLEFAFIFSQLDVEVTVVEYLDDVLSFLDGDLTAEITKEAEKAGINIYTKAEAQDIKSTTDNQALVKFKTENNENYVTADKVLMAVGRKPDLGGLEIEKLGIELNEKTGGIKVDKSMKTTMDNIYDIGDVTGKTQLAHAASHQGIVAVKNILGQRAEMKYSAIPTAIFTNPEIAVVGLTEEEAEMESREIKVGKFPVAANGKALTLVETTGVVKLIADPESDYVLGAAIIGPHATDLIAEVTLAVNNQLTTEEVIETIHAHPTSAESIHEAALDLRPEGSLHYAE